MNDNNLRAGPDGNALLFEKQAVQNARQSEMQGRPIFDTLFLVHVFAPGSKDSSPALELERVFSEGSMIAPRRTPHYDRFKDAFEAWRSGADGGTLNGTPLSSWPIMDTARIAELNAVKCFTVEQLAVWPDGALQHIGMGARELRERAKAYLADAAGGSVSGSLAADNERLRGDVTRLTGELAAVNAQLAQVNATIASLSGTGGAPSTLGEALPFVADAGITPAPTFTPQPSADPPQAPSPFAGGII